MRKNILLVIVLVLVTFFYSDALAAKTYTVKRGDCLEKIATALKIKTSELYTANAELIGSNPDLIFPGQEFLIPFNESVYSNEPNVENIPMPNGQGIVPMPSANSVEELLNVGGSKDVVPLDINEKLYSSASQYLIGNSSDSVDDFSTQNKARAQWRGWDHNVPIFFSAVFLNVILAGWFFVRLCKWVKKKLFGDEIFDDDGVGRAFIGLLKKDGCHQYCCIDGKTFLTVGVTRAGSFIGSTFGHKFKSCITFIPPDYFKERLAEFGFAEGDIWPLRQWEKKNLIQQTCLHLKRFG